MSESSDLAKYCSRHDTYFCRYAALLQLTMSTKVYKSGRNGEKIKGAPAAVADAPYNAVESEADELELSE